MLADLPPTVVVTIDTTTDTTPATTVRHAPASLAVLDQALLEVNGHAVLDVDLDVHLD